MIFWYSYWSLISVLFSCIAWHAYTWCSISYHVVSCHLPDITLMSCYHLTSGTAYLTLIIIMIMGMMNLHLDYTLINPDMSQYNRTPDTYVLLLLITCSYSFPKSDNYLINHKMIQLKSGQGKLTNINMCSCFTVVLGMLCNQNFQFDLRASRCFEGSAGSLHPITFMKKVIQ